MTKISRHMILCAFCIFFILPFIWMIMSSFKVGSSLYNYPPHFWPQNGGLQNYITAMKYGNFLSYSINSIIIAFIATIMTLFLSGIAGYSLSKLQYRGRHLIFLLLMTSTMISSEATLTGSFTVIFKLGLYDSLLGVIIPAIATPTGIFIMRQAFMTVPNSFIESARIDGASEFKIFLLISPLVKSSFGILAILSFMWRWNSFLWPFLILNNPKLYTFQVGLANLIGEFQIDWNSLIAASVLGMIPSIIIFLIFQKHFVRVNISSGEKG